MDDEALVVAPEDFIYECNQFSTNLIIIVYIFLYLDGNVLNPRAKINSDYAAVTIYSHCPNGFICEIAVVATKFIEQPHFAAS